MEKQQRLIDAYSLKRWLETNKANVNPLDYNTRATYAECITMVEVMETIDAEPVRHGEWIPFSDHMWSCSNCRVMGSPQWKRCPVCEAKMDGGLPHNVGQATGGAEDA